MNVAKVRQIIGYKAQTKEKKKHQKQRTFPLNTKHKIKQNHIRFRIFTCIIIKKKKPMHTS